MTLLVALLATVPDDPLLVEARSAFERWWEDRTAARHRPPATPDEETLRRHDAAVAELAVAADLAADADAAASEAETQLLGARASLRHAEEEAARRRADAELAARGCRSARPTLEQMADTGGPVARAAAARWLAAVEAGLAGGDVELGPYELELLRWVPDDAPAAREEVARIAQLGHEAISAKLDAEARAEAAALAGEALRAAESRLSETTAAATRLSARRAAAEAALAAVEADPRWRAASVVSPGGPLPPPSPALASTYATLLDEVEQGSRPGAAHEWCVVHVHKGILDAAAGRLSENLALRTAAGSWGGTCAATALPYREDPLVDAAWRNAERWVDAEAAASVTLAADRAGGEALDVLGYDVDGVGAATGRAELSLAPGPHRFDVRYVDGTRRALTETVGVSQRLRLQANATGLELVLLGDGEPGDPHLVGRDPAFDAEPRPDAGGAVSLAWLPPEAPAFTVATHAAAVHAYDVSFVAFGGSLDLDPGWRSGIGFALAADLGVSELPIWIGRWDHETRASWFTLTGRWRMLPRRVVSPELGLGAFGAPDIAAGPAVRLAASGRFGRLALNLAVETPFYLGHQLSWARFGWVAPRVALEVGLRSPPRAPRTEIEETP